MLSDYTSNESLNEAPREDVRMVRGKKSPNIYEATRLDHRSNRAKGGEVQAESQSREVERG